MKQPALYAAVLAIVVCSVTGWTDGATKDKDAKVKKALSKIAQLGPGVHAIKKDGKGRITSCIVVGQSRISTVLGKAKGLQNARMKARLDASAQGERIPASKNSLLVG